MSDRRPAPVRILVRAWSTRARRWRWVDVVLGSLGVAFGAVLIGLPFGRDQGLYYFVGREWLKHGEMPYRDALEQKTPAIFFLHAFAIALFGEHMASIRVLEVACLIALGLVCARLTTPMGKAVPPGIRGASVLAAAVMYVGFFDFWDTAQCEIWCTTAALASACAAMRVAGERRAAIVAGILGGVALVFKPPGAPLVALAGAGLLQRVLKAPERRLRRAAWVSTMFGAAALAPGALVVVYFAAKGALPAMIDVLVGANAYYVQHERGVQTLSDVAQRSLYVYGRWNPLSSLLLAGLVAGVVVGLVRRDRALCERHGFALLACGAAVLGVLSQLKFYGYHWGLVVAPATLAASNGALDAVALVRWRMPRRGPVVAPVLFVTGLLGAFALTGRCAKGWLGEVTATKDWLTGRTDREDFARTFEVPSQSFKLHDYEQVGLWLRENTAPSDEIAVRGFEPEIYALAGRRYGGRFFWTSFLTDPRRGYRREEWLAQDHAQLLERKPRWVVAVAWVHQGPDAPEYFEAMGYVVRKQIFGSVTWREPMPSERADPWRRVERATLAVSVVVICAVHAPLIGYKAFANVDEAYASAIGERLLDGFKLYEGAVSQRGPLMYYAYEGIAWLHGWDNIRALRLWALGFALAHLFGVWLLGRWLLRRPAGILATLITGYSLSFGFPAFDGYALHGETLQLPALLGATLLGALAMRKREPRARRMRLLGAGLAYGLAASIKQSVFLHPVVLVVWLLVDAHRRRVPLRAFTADLGVLAASTALAPAAFVANAWHSGTLKELVYYTVTYNREVHLQPAPSQSYPWLPNLFFRLGDGTSFFIVVAILLSAGAPVIVRRLRTAWHERSFWALGRGFGVVHFLALNFAVALISAAYMIRFFPHYFLQAAPFAALCLGACVAPLARSARWAPAVRRAAWGRSASCSSAAGWGQYSERRSTAECPTIAPSTTSLSTSPPSRAPRIASSSGAFLPGSTSSPTAVPPGATSSRRMSPASFHGSGRSSRWSMLAWYPEASRRSWETSIARSRPWWSTPVASCWRGRCVPMPPSRSGSMRTIATICALAPLTCIAASLTAPCANTFTSRDRSARSTGTGAVCPSHSLFSPTRF